MNSRRILYLQLDNTKRHVEGRFVQSARGIEVGDDLLCGILCRSIRVRIDTISRDTDVDNFLGCWASCGRADVVFEAIAKSGHSEG